MFPMIYELLFFVDFLHVNKSSSQKKYFIYTPFRSLEKYVNHLAIFVSLLNFSPVSSVTEINVDYINVSSCHVSLLYIFVLLLYIILIRSCLYCILYHHNIVWM